MTITLQIELFKRGDITPMDVPTAAGAIPVLCVFYVFSKGGPELYTG